MQNISTKHITFLSLFVINSISSLIVIFLSLGIVLEYIDFITKGKKPYGYWFIDAICFFLPLLCFIINILFLVKVIKKYNYFTLFVASLPSITLMIYLIVPVLR
jgi:hypothetical protein